MQTGSHDSHEETLTLADYIHTFGQDMLGRYGERIHKIAIDAAFTCPNRDGTKGRGGCSFCNNASFSPNGLRSKPIAMQLESGRRVIRRRTGARRYIAYFQAYTNTYAGIDHLRALYDEALSHPDVAGLSIGTRPDCVPEEVLKLLAGYQQQGFEVWLEPGLQSSFDATLARVNRGHDFAGYCTAVQAAHRYGLRICTHLMAGLPGENKSHVITTLQRVLDHGVAGLKIHPLHVVRGTRLANEWRCGDYTPLRLDEYVDTVCDVIAKTPDHVVFHRLTGTAPVHLLLAPAWCGKKWLVLNAIRNELKHRGIRQGSALYPYKSCPA
jgi:radical SAM protein (TIGR01212 family)